MEKLGKRLKALRLERDLTMENLVADMNAKFNPERPFNKGMISRWEKGNTDPSLENAKCLSMYFDVSLDYLIGLSDVRTPSRLLTKSRKPMLDDATRDMLTAIDIYNSRKGENNDN